MWGPPLRAGHAIAPRTTGPLRATLPPEVLATKRLIKPLFGWGHADICLYYEGACAMGVCGPVGRPHTHGRMRPAPQARS